MIFNRKSWCDTSIFVFGLLAKIMWQKQDDLFYLYIKGTQLTQYKYELFTDSKKLFGLYEPFSDSKMQVLL